MTMANYIWLSSVSVYSLGHMICHLAWGSSGYQWLSAKLWYHSLLLNHLYLVILILDPDLGNQHKSHNAPFHIPQCTIQNRNVHISVLNGALWDMEQVHYGICEIGLFHLSFSDPLVWFNLMLWCTFVTWHVLIVILMINKKKHN